MIAEERVGQSQHKTRRCVTHAANGSGNLVTQQQLEATSTCLQIEEATLNMKSHSDFRAEMSVITFLFLWTMSWISLVQGAQDVQVKIIKEGKNCEMQATPGDHLKVHYTGRFDDENGKIFDSSHNRGQLYKFQLGAGQVIQGYERGVPGMCLGEIRTLTVPPHLAYGEHGVPNVIPGGSTLHFTVELVEMEKGKLRTLHPGLRMDL